MVLYQRGDDTTSEEERRRHERRRGETCRGEAGLCPSEKTLIAVGFFVVIILLSVNLWFTIRGSGPSQKYPPAKTLTPEEIAQMIADAVKMERNLNHHEPFHHHKNPDEKEDVLSPSTNVVPAKADTIEKEKMAHLTKEAGVKPSAEISCGGGGGVLSLSFGLKILLGKGNGQGDLSCSDKGDGHYGGGKFQ